MSFHEKVLSGFVTDRAVISCGYCGVTAHYTKLNSQLLNSVGMMIALK